MNGLDSIAIQFYAAGTKYSAAIQPYALKLFFALLLIEILVTWIQYTAEGQLDPSYCFGRLVKHILSGGFVYLMIVNAFSWMTAVIGSFSAIGAAATGLPSLSPQSVLQIGGNIATTIFNAPATASLITNLELAIVQSVSAFIVLIAFVVTAAMLLLTLIESYLVVGGGVILLGLGVNRFTAPAAEGYFGYVIRVGVRLLFFYLVLAIGVQMANQCTSPRRLFGLSGVRSRLDSTGPGRQATAVRAITAKASAGSMRWTSAGRPGSSAISVLTADSVSPHRKRFALRRLCRRALKIQRR